MSDKAIRQVLRRNIRANGEAVQLIKLVEECGELVQAVSKLWIDGGSGGLSEDNIEHLAEEMADVEICMEELRMIFTGLADKEARWIDRKVQRLGVRQIVGSGTV